MRSLSKVFKDSDIVLETHCLVLDYIEDNSKTELISCDKSLNKPREILWQARLKAYKLIENAIEYANKIIKNANQKAVVEFENSRKKGYEDGFDSGKTEAIESIEGSIDEFLQLIADIDKEKDHILNKYERELKQLALDIAKKVIDAEIDNKSEFFLSIYKNAVKDYNGQKRVKVTVSGHEAEFVMSQAEILLEMTKGAKDIEIAVLDNAPRGTCIVETQLSIVDASVETQFNKLKDTLTSVEEVGYAT